MSKTVPQIKTDILKFDAQTIRVCQRYVRSVQRKLSRVLSLRRITEGNRKKIRLFTWLLSKRSRAVRILSVYRATIENEGKNTAGIDGMKVLEGKKEKEKKHNS
jgi:retron-type reverse transcriptase